MKKRSQTFAGTSGVIRPRVHAAEPRRVRFGGHTFLRFESLETRTLLSVDWFRVWVRAEETGNVTDAWVPDENHGPITFGDVDKDGLVDLQVVNLDDNGGPRVVTYEAPFKVSELAVAGYCALEQINARELKAEFWCWAGYRNNTVYCPTDFVSHVTGESGDDHIYGGNKDDEIWGESGADWLEGGRGRDSLSGGTEVDVLIGNSIENYADGDPDYMDEGCGAAGYYGYERIDATIADNDPRIHDYYFEAVYVPPQPPEPTALPNGWTFEIDTLTIDLRQTNGSVNELGPSAVDVVWAGGHREIRGFRILKIYGTDQAEQFRFERLTDVAIEIFGNGGDDEVWGNMTFHGGPGADTFHGHGEFFAADGGVDDYWPTFDAGRGDRWGDRDESSPQTFQVIVSWNDETGVTTIEAKRVHFEEVSYPGVDGNFYRLHLNEGLADDQWYPLVFRQNNLISVGALSLDNITYSTGLKAKLQANGGLAEYVVEPLPGVVDPLHG